MELHRIVRDVPNFPKAGIVYKDITPVLKCRDAFRHLVHQMIQRVKDVQIDRIVGIESRGFILGAAMAYEMGVGFSPVRKQGKLPWKTKSASYELEYGQDQVEIHEDAVHQDERVLIVDDLIATGGTAFAAHNLVRDLGGEVVGLSVFIELEFLKGKELLGEVPVHSLVRS